MPTFPHRTRVIAPTVVVLTVGTLLFSDLAAASIPHVGPGILSACFETASPAPGVTIIADRSAYVALPDGNCPCCCGNDPVNNSDPRGLSPGGGNALSLGPGFDFYPRGGWSTTLDDFERRELNGWGAVGQTPELAVYAAMVPVAAKVNEYRGNSTYYDSQWLGLNATFNPMVECLLSGDEASSGEGLHASNTGQDLAMSERWWSAGRSGLAFGETALLAYGGAKVLVPRVGASGKSALDVVV